MRKTANTIMAIIITMLILAAWMPGKAEGGIFYPRYWGLDAQTVWVYQPTWTVVPTGYWGGGYPYSYGGYSWSGWYHPYSGYYAGHYGGSWGWGAPGWYYGFTDWYAYRSWTVRPYTIYTWSRYWDPEGTGYTMDFYTEVDDEGKALAISSSVGNDVEVGDHYWSYNGGQQEGTFTSLMWCVANPFAVEAYLQAEGFDAATIRDILSEQILLDAFASNYDASSGTYGDDVIGIQWASYDIPEPATLGLLALGGLCLLRRRQKQ